MSSTKDVDTLISQESNSKIEEKTSELKSESTVEDSQPETRNLRPKRNVTSKENIVDTDEDEDDEDDDEEYVEGDANEGDESEEESQEEEDSEKELSENPSKKAKKN